MEEFDKKLLSKDSTVVSLLVSKLVENIKEKYESGEGASPQLSFLQNKCLSLDSRITEIAAEGILKLLNEGILDSNKLLEEYITLIPNNKLSGGFVKAISGALYDMFLKNNMSKFNMYQPQHPFIILLISSSECFPHIYKEIRFTPQMEENSSWNMWNYSFYQYCLCNPTNKKPMFYKMKLWLNLLLSNEDDDLVMKLLCWMPFDPAGSLLVSSELLNELASLNSRTTIDTEVILMLQVNALHRLISKGHDPRDSVFAIKHLLKQMNKIDCANPMLLILVKSITRVQSCYALDILQICERLIGQPNVNYFVLQSVRVSLLHWIGNPSYLTANVHAKASEIYIHIDQLTKKEQTANSNILEIYEKYEGVIITNQELCVAYELTIIIESWKQKESILEFLKRVECSGYQFIRKVIHLIFGLFICDSNNDDITLTAFRIICTYLENFKKFSHHVLTLILYNLSNTSNPKIHFKLFEYLPKLGTVNENYLQVVTAIKVLHGSSDDVLKTFGMRLIFELWRGENKAYPFLEEMLTEEEPTQHKCEFYINKAHIIKQICTINSKLYGEEMVALLSRILNKCSGMEGELASSIAIDAISILCSEGIIDIKTTWLTLAPKYLMDKRTETVRSMCGLASAISGLMHPEHHKDLQKEVICKIWEYAINSSDTEMRKAALDCLVEFGLENISPYFPEQYLNEDSMPISDITVNLVAGNCWINFLKDQQDVNLAGDFLIKMIKKEVDEYPKHVYHITSKREPTDYSLLPTHSLVRGVVQYCTTQMKRWNGLRKHVFIECMRILSQEYSKPLPPFNWYFLQELFTEPELKMYCVTIATHQVMISGTSRRFMEKYVETLTADYKNLEEVLFVYRNLKFLANSLQPMILEEFFKATLNHAQYLKIESNNEEFLNSLIEALKEFLVNPSVQDISKRGIASYVDEKLLSLNESDYMFKIFLNCVPCYPTTLLKNITSSRIYEGITDELYRKAVTIRCKLALDTEEKLKWLDDLIDMNRVDTKQNYPLEEFLDVFQRQNSLTQCIQWTMDLIGRIESSIVNSSDQTYVEFLVEVLVVAIVAFSGFHIFAHKVFEIDRYLRLLPQAADVLLQMKEWIDHSPKVIECFYFFNTNREAPISKVYRNAFGQSLQALRHHVEFKKSNKWIKYLNADVLSNRE